VISRVAYLSMHTSPLLQPGIGEAGGMNVYVDELARTMAARGIEADVYTRRDGPHLPDQVEVIPGYRVIHVDAGPPLGLSPASLPRHVRRFAGQVSKSLETSPPDVIHAHYWLSGWAGLLVKRHLGRPLAHSFHTLGRAKDLARRDDDPPESLLRIAAEHEVIEGSDCVIASTPDEADQLLSHYGADPRRLCTSPPGLDHRLFHPGSKAAARRRLGLGNYPIVAYVGRIQPLKGVDVVVEAFAQVVSRRPDAHLLVVGGPSGARGETEMQRLRSTVSAHGLTGSVLFLGAVPHGLVRNIYLASDVLLVPSRSESFGMVAVEAQACGTPVIAARIGGLVHAIGAGGGGVLVDGWDPADYAEQVVTLLADPVAATMMGQRGVEWSRGFSWDATARRFLELYREVTAAHPWVRIGPPS
jgi:D-inositol-3-phosphate glycosyltransferase